MRSAEDELSEMCARHLRELQSKLDHFSEGEDSIAEADASERLLESLSVLQRAKLGRAAAASEHQARMRQLSDLVALEERAAGLKAELQGLRTDVATRASPPIAAGEVSATWSTLSGKMEAIRSARLEFMRLSSASKRQERLLRQKEELSAGVNLIEYEQLKLLNQSLAQRIEQKEKELLVANSRRLKYMTS
ncbi:hypothetical protein DFJ74DRAFT_706521 [Hyaloraphidium curvatum]|nr:hypothetical protein DFJ74DRAFT_706521 [Hyaloraphidium curvatum]